MADAQTLVDLTGLKSISYGCIEVFPAIRDCYLQDGSKIYANDRLLVEYLLANNYNIPGDLMYAFAWIIMKGLPGNITRNIAAYVTTAIKENVNELYVTDKKCGDFSVYAYIPDWQMKYDRPQGIDVDLFYSDRVNPTKLNYDISQVQHWQKFEIPPIPAGDKDIDRH